MGGNEEEGAITVSTGFFSNLAALPSEVVCEVVFRGVFHYNRFSLRENVFFANRILRMKNVFFLFACLLLFRGMAAPLPREHVLARAEILQGVESIDLEGAALSPLLIIDQQAFPLAECKNPDETAAFVATGSFVGRGRAVWLSHPAFFDSKFFLKDTKTFLKNAVCWAGGSGKKKLRIAVLRDPGVVQTIESLGYPAAHNIRQVKQAKGYDVLLVRNFQQDDIEDLVDYVRGGGGLIGASLGWVFAQYNPTGVFAKDFLPNRVMAPMGVLMGRVTVRKINGGYPTECRNIPQGTFLEDALALVSRGQVGGDAGRVQLSRTITFLMEALPPGLRPDLTKRLSALTSSSGRSKIPSPSMPFRSQDTFPRLVLMARQNAWLSNLESVWEADPASVVYPGKVRPGTPAVTKTVPIDLTVPRWHSTGVYAPAGVPITITLSSSDVQRGLSVRVGTTADNLTNCDEWKRAPLVTMQIPLNKVATTFSSPYGGLVYIVVPSGYNFGKTQVQIAGGVMAPWFKLGRDTKEQFVRDCMQTGAPYGEIEGNDFVITTQTEGLRRVQDPAWIAQYWDRVLAACEDLLQNKEKRPSPERICSDVQLSAGFLHSGYPIMFYVNSSKFDGVIDKSKLLRSTDVWGYFHELGHNHQSPDWTPGGTGEITVNLFTCYIIEECLKEDCRNGHPMVSRNAANSRVRQFASGPRTYEKWSSDPFLGLEMYLRIKEAYGWEAFKKTFGRYTEPGFVRPQTDHERWQTFARELSRSVNADMSEPLSKWAIPIDGTTRAFCSKFPPADPSISKGL